MMESQLVEKMHSELEPGIQYSRLSGPRTRFGADYTRILLLILYLNGKAYCKRDFRTSSMRQGLVLSFDLLLVLVNGGKICRILKKRGPLNNPYATFFGAHIFLKEPKGLSGAVILRDSHGCTIIILSFPRSPGIDL